MFTIHTANPGEAWHHLHPTERFGYEVKDFGFDFEMRVDVRVDYGNPDGPYILRFWLYDSALGVETEVVTADEYKRRCEQATENGDVYTTEVHILHDAKKPSAGAALTRYVQRLETHFRAIMTLGLFKLPANF